MLERFRGQIRKVECAAAIRLLGCNARIAEAAELYSRALVHCAVGALDYTMNAASGRIGGIWNGHRRGLRRTLLRPGASRR